MTPTRRENIGLALLLAAILAALSLHADQPIVENYVGRQIPTAMVARNLDRGSGFFQPTLDTAPFPNRFLVEPPVYAALVVGVKAALGFGWEEVLGRQVGSVWEISGRLTSALLLTLGAWALYHLVRRREGPVVAWVALAAFGSLPVTLRYGRAFQPDATMVGFVLLGMAGWDVYQAEGRRRWGWLGGVALAMALATKITAAWVLIPFALVVTRLPVRGRLVAGLAMLAPALSWYGWAWYELRHAEAGGSLASADNAALWAGSFAPGNWVRFATWEAVARNLLVRAFSPLGLGLGLAGLALVGPRLRGDRLWLGYGIGCALAVVATAAKWHHGYYWLVVAPLVAVGVGRVLVQLGRLGKLGWVPAAGLGLLFLGASTNQAASTWRTPAEWRLVAELPDLLPTPIPNWLLIAPEAVIFYADRPGLRLEFSPEAIPRAAGEWGGTIPPAHARAAPLALVDFYEERINAGLPLGTGATTAQRSAARSGRVLVIDVGPTTGDDRRTAFRAALRRRSGSKVWQDRPELIIVEIGSNWCAPTVTLTADEPPVEPRPITTGLTQSPGMRD